MTPHKTDLPQLPGLTPESESWYYVNKLCGISGSMDYLTQQDVIIILSSKPAVYSVAREELQET